MKDKEYWLNFLSKCSSEEYKNFQDNLKKFDFYKNTATYENLKKETTKTTDNFFKAFGINPDIYKIKGI